MKDEIVNVTEEIVETAMVSGNEKMKYIAIGAAGGVVVTLGTIKIYNTLKAKKEAKSELSAEEADEE